MAGFDSKEYVKERYELLLKAYGEHSEYVSGFRACMEIIEREVCEMKPYEATEVAYKNGYKQGRAEAIKEVYTRLSMNFGTYTDDDSVKLVDLFRFFDQIAKEMGVEL